MTKDKHLPVPRRDELPDDNKAQLPAPPGTNGGLVTQGLSRFWARLGRGTTEDNTDLVKSQTKYVEAYGRLADTTYETKRKVDRLRHDLPSQLEADRLDHQDRMDEARHQVELRKRERRAALDAFDANDERERMTRDLDYMKTAADKRRVLTHARRQEAEARVRHSVMERTADMQVEQAINAFLTGDYATLNKLMLAKRSFETAWGTSQIEETAVPSELEQRLAIIEALDAKAQAENASAEFRVRLHDEIKAIKNEIEAANADREIP